MYLVLSPNVAHRSIINFQSVGQAIKTVSSLKVLESVKEDSMIIVFYDFSIDLQKLLDLNYLLNLKYTIIVNNKEDEALFDSTFDVRLIDYKIIDGSLIRAILANDSKAIEMLSRDTKDSQSITYRKTFKIELEEIANGRTSTDREKLVVEHYKNLLSLYLKNKEEVETLRKSDTKYKLELFSLKQTLNKFSKDVKSFITYFANLQNSFKAVTALTIIKESSKTLIPSHIASLYFKNYGIPNVFPLLSALYDNLTVFYKKYVKVIYICNEDGISINTVPYNYLVVNNDVTQAEVVTSDFICLVGNVKTPLEFIFNSSAMDAVIIVDARRVQEDLVQGETLKLNLAPDMTTVDSLNLVEELTITPSAKSKYRLEDDKVNQRDEYGNRNSELVVSIVNTLLEQRGEL